METKNICTVCKNEIVRDKDSVGTGYGYDQDHNKICYDCCGKLDTEAMKKLKPGEKYYLYLSKRDDGWFISNWPGTLKKKVYVKSGRHNIARVRYDTWFKVDGVPFWGVRYGDHTEILHCTRLNG